MGATIGNPLGWAIVHSLWQGGAIALVYLAIDAGLRRASANVRYATACLALVAMLLVPAATFVSLAGRGNPPTAAVAMTGTGGAAASPGVVRGQTNRLPYTRSSQPDVSAIAWLWVAGVTAMSLWSALGWAAAQRLKRRSRQPLPELWQRKLKVLAARLGIRRAVSLWESALAHVPAVIGWLRPAILIPAGALLRLTPEELEAVIAHELAHVRRFDYLVNVLQSLVEILMFYHPAAWWIGHRIRAERENCCDDLAVAACGNRLVYAHALTALEELRAGEAQFAMAATAGSLVSRIRRVLGQDEPRRRFFPVGVALLTLLVVVLGVWSEHRPRAGNSVARRGVMYKVRLAQTTGSTSRQGYLAGLVDAGYTDISVDEIIELKNNGVNPKLIKSVMQAGLGTPTPNQLIALTQNGVGPEFVQLAAAAQIADMNMDRLVDLRRNGVDVSCVRRIHLLGFGPFTTEQVIQLQRNGGLQPELFEALKDSGYAKVDVRQTLEALRAGLSPGALRSVHEQGFRNLTLDQVVKLKRAGVI